jgi:hypothetical protein
MTTRRAFIAGTVGLLAVPSLAQAQALRGTWIVRCPDGHDDIVTGITRNHNCEKCGKTSVSGGGAMVVCPNGHASGVDGITEHHKCTTCGQECRRD